MYRCVPKNVTLQPCKSVPLDCTPAPCSTGLDQPVRSQCHCYRGCSLHPAGPKVRACNSHASCRVQACRLAARKPTSDLCHCHAVRKCCRTRRHELTRACGRGPSSHWVDAQGVRYEMLSNCSAIYRFDAQRTIALLLDSPHCTRSCCKQPSIFAHKLRESTNEITE